MEVDPGQPIRRTALGRAAMLENNEYSEIRTEGITAGGPDRPDYIVREKGEC